MWVTGPMCRPLSEEGHSQQHQPWSWATMLADPRAQSLCRLWLIALGLMPPSTRARGSASNVIFERRCLSRLCRFRGLVVCGVLVPTCRPVFEGGQPPQKQPWCCATMLADPKAQLMRRL
jgi:hypothetical protein